MKTPPDRSGIIFEVGAQLEARDRHKKWYTATIEKIDYDKERVLIHYRQWSRRHDEWFQWSSPYLRPLERVSLRRKENDVFVSGAKVLACWTDCRFYPAKILSVNRDGEALLQFNLFIYLLIDSHSNLRIHQISSLPANFSSLSGVLTSSV
uniref:Tudor domain-containing protein n=1 Tax=Mola mola TaxID=94237 RepID=A0A3Q4B549_MOLML